jgi:ABC-type branched-subunit amino acid transport system ATPase component
MFRKITIDGFRGIDDFSMEDFRRVNVMVGRNGAGKTSILEATIVAAAPNAPGLLLKANSWRDMPAANSRSWHNLLTLFSDMDPHRTIRFEYEADDETASIEVDAMFGASGTDSQESGTGTGYEETLRGLRMQHRPEDGKESESVLELLEVGFQQTVERKPQRRRSAGSFFIHSRRATSLGETASALTTLYSNKCEERFIDAIKKVDPRVQRLVPGTQGGQPTVLADLGGPTLVPISVLGDGFCRVALMVTGMVLSDAAKLLIVDEIDSGLHRSVMQGLWESVLELSHHYDFQVFCSTHNEEMLRQTLPAFSDEPDALRVYRIERSADGKVSQQPYDYAMLHDAEAAGMDIR